MLDISGKEFCLQNNCRGGNDQMSGIDTTNAGYPAFPEFTGNLGELFVHRMPRKGIEQSTWFISAPWRYGYPNGCAPRIGHRLILRHSKHRTRS